MMGTLHHVLGSLWQGRRQVFLIVLVSGLLILGMRVLASNFVWTAMGSVPGKLFMLKPDEAVRKGSIILFHRDDTLMPEGVFKLTKYALCMPGEVLKRVANSFYCDGELISVAKDESLTGLPLRIFEWSEGPIPEGFVYVGSDHPNGYDSRYFGLIRVSETTVMEALL